jgi:hypothetical protein
MYYDAPLNWQRHKQIMAEEIAKAIKHELRKAHYPPPARFLEQFFCDDEKEVEEGGGSMVVWRLPIRPDERQAGTTAMPE